ncbi:GAF domain-containing protein [Coraliomargarita sp. SDUM461003]|uniref:GAF domain-containing protein n=1 Tax=Thalassobacterium maritimum TaxID=3041265 RepID=A0ABU1AX55_9BACT|nr:GAF domain-containing protein [Coraliomargarita sp. SDUM461003]MDQ8208726.1 GAF domain-containing protein [Coraliomargarita sp. SDUM461003]
MLHQQLRKSCHSLLDEGVERLDLPVGIVSHIYNGLYKVIAINSEMGELVDNAIFPLEKTYCRAVYESQETLAITSIDGIAGMRLHPLYLELPLEAYLGTPIMHKGRVWGTVNFSSSKLHAAFTDRDRALVEAYAATVSEWLAAMDAPKLGDTGDTFAPFGPRDS